MNYYPIASLTAAIRANLHRIPSSVDIVVGVPRSGLMAGSLVALALNLPLAEPDGFAAGRVLRSGTTRRRAALDKPWADMRHVLLVDDSVVSGGSICAARDMLAAACPGVTITTAAIIGIPEAARMVDLVFDTVPLPRAFEWNVMHHDILLQACVDIDGVLCVDPTPAENDDGPAYLRFLADARPLCLPTKPVGTLVTSRLEKYRAPTEAWLAKHGVQYRALEMLDLPDAETRRRTGAHGTFKGAVFRNSPALLFIESEPAQSRQIAAISGKPVLCFGTGEFVRPSPTAVITNLQRIRRSHKVRRAIGLLRTVTKRAG